MLELFVTGAAEVIAQSSLGRAAETGLLTTRVPVGEIEVDLPIFQDDDAAPGVVKGANSGEHRFAQQRSLRGFHPFLPGQPVNINGCEYVGDC